MDSADSRRFDFVSRANDQLASSGKNMYHSTVLALKIAQECLKQPWRIFSKLEEGLIIFRRAENVFFARAVI